MATIQNDRDILLQGTSPRLVPIPIPISRIEGLDSALANAGRRVDITATSSTFAGVNNPTSITLTAELKGGLTGEVVWSVVTGALTLSPNGDTCVINNTSMTTASAVIRARVTVGGINYDGKYTITKLGSLAAQDYVNLQTQVVGKLNSGNVTGLGALALLNKVDLNTQTTGALNGATQITNLGSLAYANAIAADQIGAGTLAAGVVYAGTINAEKINGGNFTGKTFTGGKFVGTSFVTAESGARIEISTRGQDAHTIIARSTDYTEYTVIRAGHIFTESTSKIGHAVDIRSSNYSAMQLECNPNTPHIVLNPIPTKPSSAGWEGGIAYSSLHGFIFCNGVGWHKPAGWTAV